VAGKVLHIDSTFMTSTQSISILMPLGRLSAWFDEAVQSALQQRPSVPIHLIANSLSAEEVVRLNQLCSLHPQLNLHVFDERLPMAANWNRALHVAPEPWVVVLHDDDTLEPDFIEKMLPVMKQSLGFGIYISRERMMNHKGEFYHPEPEPDLIESHPLSPAEIRRWAFSNRICATGFILDRNLAISLGGYDESLSYTPDWDLYFRIAFTHGAVASNFFGGRYRFDSKSGQLSSQFIKTAQCVDLYREQQMKNAAILQIEEKQAIMESDRALLGFSRFISYHYLCQMSAEGVKKIARVMTNGLLQKVPRIVRQIVEKIWLKPFFSALVYSILRFRCSYQRPEAKFLSGNAK